MAGKAGRSGPPGNLNNARRPWRSFWKRRALRSEDRWILPTIESYGSGLISDKGGEESISAAEMRMIEIAQISRGCAMLILSNAARNGFTRETPANATGGASWDVAPGIRELGRFLALERSALQAIGLERRARPVPTLAEVLEKRRREAPPDAQNRPAITLNGNGTAKDLDPAEIVGPSASGEVEEGE